MNNEETFLEAFVLGVIGAIAGLALAVVILATPGCSTRISMQPGRDAIYQVVTQAVPAAGSGTGSQDATITTSGAAATGPTTHGAYVEAPIDNR